MKVFKLGARMLSFSILCSRCVVENLKLSWSLLVSVIVTNWFSFGLTLCTWDLADHLFV